MAKQYLFKLPTALACQYSDKVEVLKWAIEAEVENHLVITGAGVFLKTSDRGMIELKKGQYAVKYGAMIVALSSEEFRLAFEEISAQMELGL